MLRYRRRIRISVVSTTVGMRLWPRAQPSGACLLLCGRIGAWSRLSISSSIVCRYDLSGGWMCRSTRRRHSAPDASGSNTQSTCTRVRMRTFLYNTQCTYHLANSEIANMLRFTFDGTVLTDRSDRQAERADLAVELVAETCGGVPTAGAGVAEGRGRAGRAGRVRPVHRSGATGDARGRTGHGRQRVIRQRVCRDGRVAATFAPLLQRLFCKSDPILRRRGVLPGHLRPAAQVHCSSAAFRRAYSAR